MSRNELFWGSRKHRILPIFCVDKDFNKNAEANLKGLQAGCARFVAMATICQRMPILCSMGLNEGEAVRVRGSGFHEVYGWFPVQTVHNFDEVHS